MATAIIRISGMVKVTRKIEDTLDRLRLRRKYTCIIVNENLPEINGLLKKIRDYVAFGKINQETLAKLIKARGKTGSKEKISELEALNIAKEIMTGKNLKETILKPYFRLHPPRGGLKSSKLHYPKGDLGNHGENINKLIEKML